jgi:hypothetical protein
MRNLKVAIATGVSPSPNAILTTTNELPQKIIRVSIRSVLKRPIVLVVMVSKSFVTSINGLVEK